MILTVVHLVKSVIHCLELIIKSITSLIDTYTYTCTYIASNFESKLYLL